MFLSSPKSAGAFRILSRTFTFSIILSLGASNLLGQGAAYFASAEGLTGDALKTKLNQLISGHTSLSYTPGVWTAHKDLYEDPANSNNLILFYSQASISKALQDNGSSPSNYFNREHLWPSSHGLGSNRDSPQRTDLFHVVPAYKGVNSDRSNQYFDYADPSLSGYTDPAHALAPDCKENTNSWEPGDGQKGWAARAILYMPTRYTFLSLVDLTPNQDESALNSQMAQRSVMLEWNRKFLPSAKELDVNQRIFETYQHNRNPYIDFPEFADAVYVDGPSWGGWRLDHFSLVELQDPAISGDGADPDKDGLTNIEEMARYSDPRTTDKLPTVKIEESNGQWAISFLRAKDTSNLNLDIILQSSPDLSTWSPVDLSEAASSDVGTSSEWITVSVGPSGTTSGFYRVEVIRP
jgi:endonuclease I